jgi:hypothetical protein
VQVGAADADGRHPDDYVTRAGLVEVDLGDFERPPDTPEEPGPRLQTVTPSASVTALQLVTVDTFWSA